MAMRSLVIIGGGPAGMAAAIEAARAGLCCAIIDDAPRLGGQIYRQPPAEFSIRHGTDKDTDRGNQLRAELDRFADRIEVRSRTSVLGVWEDGRILWGSDQTSGVMRARRLIVATGAHERPVPFPGWTLPGVMAAGGVQSLPKTMAIRPGRRALVAGTGLLILSVARRLHEAGVEVAAILEAGSPNWGDGAFLKEWNHWDAVRDARDHWQALHRAGIPFLVNHTIFAAHGRNEVEGAFYGPLDPEHWAPLRRQAWSVEVDLVCTGFGFVPRTELTVLAGCRHDHVIALGGWVPMRNALMETTVPGVFAVGDGAGIGGALAAEEEGRVAGITVAEQAGLLSAEKAARRRTRALERLPKAKYQTTSCGAPARDKPCSR
jgi:hydrogen cyanide synthase HcnB